MTTYRSQKQLSGILSRQTVLPVILADGFAARRLALRLFLRHRWRSVLCGVRPCFAPLCIGFSWSCPRQPRLCVEQLLSLADACSDLLPILIPLSREGQTMVADYVTELESRFVISEPNALL